MEIPSVSLVSPSLGTVGTSEKAGVRENSVPSPVSSGSDTGSKKSFKGSQASS